MFTVNILLHKLRERARVVYKLKKKKKEKKKDTLGVAAAVPDAHQLQEQF